MQQYTLDPKALLGGIIVEDNDQQIVQLALQKDNEPDTRPVHRAEAFQRVDETDRVTVRHGRYGRSRPSAARGSGR